MADLPYPWRRHGHLAALARDWDRRCAGRRVDRVGGGPGWLRLTLIDTREESAPPVHCFFTARTGAALCWDGDRSPAPPVLDALGREKQRDVWVTPHLLGATFVRAGVLPEDLVLVLELRTPTGSPLHLLHQLFGPRGNTALIDGEQRRLWSAHPSPHPLLLEPPREYAAVPTEPTPADAANLFRHEAPTHLTAALIAETRHRHETDLRRARDGAERLRDNLARDLGAADDGDHWRLIGETLAIHLHTLTQGLTEVVLGDAEGVDHVITLDPAKPPHANMEDCFKKARKAQRGLETIRTRHTDAVTALAGLEAAAENLAAVDDDDHDAALEALAAWRATHDDLLPGRTSRGGRIATPPPDKPFRRYLVDGRWEVWVGRSNLENDELTHRASSPDDWWFHAQGVPGSHVILRTGGQPDQVPKAVLEKAAAIAAHHSKGRTSGIVPVMMTLRKYVRKPRKSAAGAALPQRVKTLMVEPKITGDQQH